MDGHIILNKQTHQTLVIPLKFSETQDGTHKGGTLYTQGVTYGKMHLVRS